ncbi:glycosyltransferase [Arthrospira platensis FACHB-439]|uniref:glycosyltransferase n=1 Tax=Limnospira platensis TaxID=118562 RepID=UPI00168524B5|nr:glycosyltransferase [Arthrospira platensis FACHB-439]
MKVIHSLSWYFPQSSGGTEVYVDGLVQELRSLGIESVVGASLNGTKEQSYQHNNISVYRYPLFPNQTQAQLYELEPPTGFNYFSSWLADHKSDIYHQHSWRFGCGVHHLNCAKENGLKTLVTIHMPEPLCLRGTMMLHGQHPCDGKIQDVRCSQCLGLPAKVPNWAIQGLSRVPSSLATNFQTQLKTSSSVRLQQLGRTIGTPPKVINHQKKLHRMFELSDLVIAPCQWIYDGLIANGFAREKIVLCRQGVSNFNRNFEKKQSQEKKLKIGFLGRWQDTKGAQMLAEAVHRLPPNCPVELIIHGMGGSKQDLANREKVMALASTDSRIKIADQLAREDVPKALAQLDLLAVPSQWLETGPLVVLEALAVGTPVIGSKQGGIAELVRHGIDGWLVPVTVEAWQEAIAYLAVRRDVVHQLSQSIKPVRTMKEVSKEMVVLYQKVLN